MRGQGIGRAGRAILGAAVAALSIGSAGPALAQSGGSRQVTEVTFLEQRPGVPTALTFNVDYVNPSDPQGKPPAVRNVVETLAPDARFDTAVPERCRASDPELMLMGAGACPPGSKVGTGFIRIDTGSPEPNRFLEVDVVFFNNADQLIFLNTARNGGARVVARGAIQGGRLSTTAPTLPGTPPDGAAIDIVRTRLDSISRVVGGESRAYITTPSACPVDGSWRSSLSFTYADGVTQTVESPSRCARATGGRPPGPCKRRIEGTRRRDRLVGSAASERIRGFRGNDFLDGRGGSDCLSGGAGRDRIRGGPGPDTLLGGRGRDRLAGGPGPDAITSSDRSRDSVRCGSGRDTVRADRRDRIRGCERVLRR